MNYYFISVIYNSRLEDSVAVINLLKNRKNSYKIIVIDNRTDGKTFENAKFAKENSIVYICKNMNLGLSKATNLALEYLRTLDINDSDIVTTVDDDTAISQQYLQLLEKESQKYLDVDIFAPFMQGQNGVYYSPAKQGYFKNFDVRSINQIIPQRKFYAIFSCCSSRWRVLKNYRFDEDIFVDYIDHNYCYDQRQKGRKFKQIKVVIQQNFALKNKGISREKMQARIQILINDWLAYCWNRPIRLAGYIPYWVVRGAMYSIKVSSLKLWLWTIKTAFATMIKSLWSINKNNE